MAKDDKYGDDVGWENEESEKELKKPIKTGKGGNKTFRFYLPQPKEDGDPTQSYITFLTEAPVFIREHNLKLDGRFGNYFTCLSGSGEECPLCAAGDEPYPAWALLVIDHSVWEDKKDKEHKDEVKLFVGKQRTAKEIKTQHVKRKGLAGCMFQARRTDNFSASVGDKFDFERKLKSKDLKKGGVEVPDADDPDGDPRVMEAFAIKTQKEYIAMIKEELAPKSVAVLERAARGEKPKSGDGGKADDGAVDDDDMDDIPF